MVSLPYGKTNIAFEEKDAIVLESGINEVVPDCSGAELVCRAMAQPIGTPLLSDLAKGKNNCTLIISDHTRPVPSKDILPEMLRQLRQGNPDIAITLLVATGCHRDTTKEELVAKLGQELVDREKIVVHDCADPESNVQIGILPSGAPLVIDRLAAQTDLLVSEGFIEPHFFAGFSGGRKSVLPGVCDRVTVLGNHCGAFIHSEYARTGILENNPIHNDMAAAAKMANLQYIVNVVINGSKQTVAAFAGDPFEAHKAGCDFLKNHCCVTAVPADIVITTNGGAPLDQNLYQCVKSMTAAETLNKEGGVIILTVECADGIGGEGFYRSLKECASVKELYDEMTATPQDKTIPDQWQSQILARVLMHHTVIVLTRPEMKTVVEDMKMRYASTIEDALAQAKAICGDGATITVIPDGVSVIAQTQ